MSGDEAHSLRLESLGDGIPVIPALAVAYYQQNCMVAFHLNGYLSGVLMSAEHVAGTTRFRIHWSGNVDDQMLRAYRDEIRVAENAACALALLLVRELTPYTAIEQSARGTTIDYYLSYRTDVSDLIFNNAARLEVSGILSESPDNSVQRRIDEKRRRLKKEGDLKDLIVVVEFSRPWAKLVEA